MLGNLIKLQLNSIKSKVHHITRTLTDTSAKASMEAENLHSADNELRQENIDKAIQATPVLKNISQEMWHKAHSTFLNHGLSTYSFLQIVTANPKVLMRSTSKIVDTLEHWRLCGFGEHFLFMLITKYPSLMDMDDKNRLLRQIQLLKSYVNNLKNVWKVLMNCPSLILEKEANIEAKILYIKLTMRIDIPEIIKSEALGKPLEDIKCRHVFLERLGIFKPVSLKSDPNISTKNPRLYKITDTSDKSFATKVCHVHLEEYEVFKELYARELDAIEQEDDLLSDEEK